MDDFKNNGGTIDDFDLNMIKIFWAVYTQGSVTDAGKALSMPQSNVSRSLKKLRDRVGDPLFTYRNRAMESTPRADELAKHWGPSIQNLLEPLSNKPPFDYEAYSGSLSILSSPLTYFSCIPEIVRNLSIHSPKLTLNIESSFNKTDEIELLESGKYDLLISSTKHSSNSLYSYALFRDEWCLVGRKREELVGKISTDSLSQFKIINLSGSPFIDTLDPALYPDINITNMDDISSIAPCINTIESSLGVLPLKYAMRISSNYMLDILPPPFPLTPYTANLIWHERVSSSNKHQWLFNLIQNITF